jgi:hypothetical protein
MESSIGGSIGIDAYSAGSEATPTQSDSITALLRRLHNHKQPGFGHRRAALEYLDRSITRSLSDLIKSIRSRPALTPLISRDRPVMPEFWDFPMCYGTRETPSGGRWHADSPAPRSKTETGAGSRVLSWRYPEAVGVTTATSTEAPSTAKGTSSCRRMP